MFQDTRYQIFLSSTYEDLRTERQAATQSILAMGHIAAGMELFPASDLAQLDIIKKVISESDYYVVIVGGKYGSIHPDTGTSFTELEYDHAIENGKPVLGFVAKDIGKLASERVESDRAKRAALERFRKKVLSKTCQLFDEPSDLGLKVMSSLVNETRINPQLGWIRADRGLSSEDVAAERELRKQVKIQQEEIQSLERAIRDSVISIPDTERNYACGSQTTIVTVRFSGPNKQPFIEKVKLTWDEIFSAIGPTMFGYIVRRNIVTFNNSQPVGYPFENSLCELLRAKVFDKVGQRSIYLFPHEIDRILIQFKQLGYLKMEENNEGDDNFRGFTLTELGEHALTVQSVA